MGLKGLRTLLIQTMIDFERIIMVIFFVSTMSLTTHLLPLFPRDGGKVCIAGHESMDTSYIEFVNEWGRELINLVSTYDKYLRIIVSDL